MQGRATLLACILLVLGLLSACGTTSSQGFRGTSGPYIVTGGYFVGQPYLVGGQFMGDRAGSTSSKGGAAAKETPTPSGAKAPTSGPKKQPPTPAPKKKGR